MQARCNVISRFMKYNAKFNLVELPRIQAVTFTMSPIELREYIDFDVKRVYFISNLSGDTGSHAHKVEKEFFIMVSGSCTLVIDRGYGMEEYKLSAPQSGVYVGNYLWHHFKDFTSDAVLLALSSTNYDSSRGDYIENYEEYKNLTYGEDDRKRVLILGSDGTLGGYLKKVFGEDDLYDVIATTKHSVDLFEARAVDKIIDDLRPSLIINATAYNNVDAIESEEESYKMAQSLNHLALVTLSDSAERVGAVLIHYSSEYVFDGQGIDGYMEDFIPSPINKYGQSKLMGESAVMKRMSGYYLIRTSRLFGLKGKSLDSKRSFVDTMIELSKTKDIVDVVNAEVSSPTYALDLAIATRALVDEKKQYGVYHITNHGSCTWYEFCQEIFKSTGITKKINPIDSASLLRAAKRPQHGVLLSKKIKPMRNWQEALRAYLSEVGLEKK